MQGNTMTPTDDDPGAGFPVPVDPAALPTRRERRLASRAAGRVDARGPRTGEFELTDAARAARDAAGLTAELSATGRWRWLQREDERAAQTDEPVPGPTQGRHRG
jgi:hypothetical protein